MPDPCRLGKAKFRWCWANIFNKCMDSQGILSPLYLYLSIMLHWRLIGRGRLAVPVQQAQMSVFI